MTSSGPYSQSYNFTHMFDMTDYIGPLPRKVPCPNTLLNIIRTNPDFSTFNFMLERACMTDIFNLTQANFTVFIPSDIALSKYISEDVFTNMDILTARSILKASILNERISSEILKDCPSAYYMTLDPSNRMYVSNINNETYINSEVKVIEWDITAKNGIIHVIDGLITPIIL